MAKKVEYEAESYVHGTFCSTCFLQVVTQEIRESEEKINSNSISLLH